MLRKKKHRNWYLLNQTTFLLNQTILEFVWLSSFACLVEQAWNLSEKIFRNCKKQVSWEYEYSWRNKKKEWTYASRKSKKYNCIVRCDSCECEYFSNYAQEIRRRKWILLELCATNKVQLFFLGGYHRNVDFLTWKMKKRGVPTKSEPESQ